MFPDVELSDKGADLLLDIKNMSFGIIIPYSARGDAGTDIEHRLLPSFSLFPTGASDVDCHACSAPAKYSSMNVETDLAGIRRVAHFLGHQSY